MSIFLILEQYLLIFVSLMFKLGDTVLHYAAYKKMTQVVKKAISLGADAGIKNARGLLPVDVIDSEDSSMQASSIRAMLLTATKNWAELEKQKSEDPSRQAGFDDESPLGGGNENQLVKEDLGL